MTNALSDSKVQAQQERPMLVSYQLGFILSFNPTRETAPASCSPYSVWTHFDKRLPVDTCPRCCLHIATQRGSIYQSIYSPTPLRMYCTTLNNTGTSRISFAVLTWSRTSSSMHATSIFFPFTTMHPQLSRDLGAFTPRDDLGSTMVCFH